MADGKVIVDTDLDASGFKDGLSKMGSLAASGLKATTTAITAVGSGLLAMAGYAIKAGSDFEAAMSQVEAISGASSQQVVTSSGEMVDGLTAITDKAKEMGATTKFSATESAEALNYMAMAGWDSQAMYDGLAGIMNLAAASGENLATTSDIVTDALTAFGMTADQSGHFADVLAQTSASANTNVGLLGESFKYVAPLCGTLGYSAEDASIALGLMANAGIKGSQAGTALKTALANLSAPTDKQALMMDKLGISLKNSDGSMKSLRQVMGNLRSSFKDLDEAEQTAAASTIFGKEAMSGMLNIINASDEDFEKLTNSIDNCGGAAEEMAAIMQDNLQGDITILKSGIEGLGIAVYEKLQMPLRDCAQKGQEYIQQLTDAFNNGGFEGLVTEIGTIFADAVSEIVAATPQVVSAAVSVIQAFISGLSSSMPEVTASAIEIGTELISGISQIIPQALSFGLDFITNLALGIAQSAPALTSDIGTCISNMLNTLATGFPDFLSAGTQMIVSIAQGIGQQLPSIGEAALNCVEALLSGLVENGPILLEAGIQLLQNLADGIVSALPELIPLALETIVSLADAFISNIGSIVDIGIQLITALAEGVVNSIPLLITEVPRIINDFWAAFDENAIKLLQAGLNLIVKLGQGIIQNIPLIIANAGEIVSAIFNTIMHLDLLSAGKTLIKNLGSGIKAMIGEAGNAAKSVADNVLNMIKNTDWLGLGKNIMTFLKNGITGMLSAVGSAGGNVAKAAWNAIKNIDWLGLGKNIITFLINGVKGMIGSMGTAALNVAKAGMNAFKNCDWAGIGINLVKGIASGVANAAGSLVDAAVSAAKNAINTVKGWLGIKSPSRRAKEEIGKWILPGAAEGVEETQPILNESMQDAAEGMMDAFNAADDIDVSGLVDKMRRTVNAEVGDITQDITVKSNSGGGQVAATESERMDYGRLGAALIDALANAGIKVEMDERELGRLIAELS